jgi:hypothetical protein
MAAATRLYERLGFCRAPEFDVEIGEAQSVDRAAAFVGEEGEVEP